VSQPITLHEYDYLSSRLEGERCRCIPQRDFDYLERLCLGQVSDVATTTPFMKPALRGGGRALQVLNYAGVIHTPSGLQIEVLPKLGRALADSEERVALARSVLLKMLCHLNGFRHIATTDAQIAARKLPLFEVFVRQFLTSVNTVVKRGLRSDYLQRRDNLLFLRGKLLAGEQIKHNLVHPQRFYVEFDEFFTDRPINRLLHSALKKILSHTRVVENQRLCRELLFAFNDVPQSWDIKADFAATRLDRGMDYYKPALSWARLILEGMSPLSMHGGANAMSLLFPMEAVFESYVADISPRWLIPSFHLSKQVQGKTLVSHQGKEWFRLKPDLTIASNGVPLWILDTKWKLLDDSKNNGKAKYGLAQSDFYQMFAYAEKYLGERNGDLLLIYPMTDSFSEPIQEEFRFSARHSLWIVPFDLFDDSPSFCPLKLPDPLLDKEIFKA